MGQLIDDLLVFSRIGRAEMQTVTVNLGHLLAEVLKEAQPDLRGRTIDWQIDPLPTVRGDPETLRLALANLVSNAVKYTGTRERPKIEIGARIIDRHGGRTWAEGESGRGAAFYFSLPKNREAAA
jgi:signal transduction histidine kinase